MPKSTRQWAQDELKGALGHIDWVGTHIIRVVEKYTEHHPEISEPLRNNLTPLMEISDNINKILTEF